jgi:signal transduction histidine kinase
MDRLLHALDAALLGHWDESKSALRYSLQPIATRLLDLIGELQDREQCRRAYLSQARHEIANPLSVACANIEGMLHGVLDRDDARLESILTALKQAAVLLEDVRDPLLDQGNAAPAHISREPLDVHEIVATEVTAIDGMASLKNITITRREARVDRESARHAVSTDPVRFRQVLRNVLINAVRYTPPGGSIEVETESHDGELAIHVADSGPGLRYDDLPRLFEPGYRAKEASGVEGCGIGLAVVRHWLQRLGGEIEVTPRPDRQGTVFTIRFRQPVTA